MVYYLSCLYLHILRVQFLPAFTEHQPGRQRIRQQRAQLHLNRQFSLCTLQLIINLQLFNIEVRQKLQLHRADDAAVMEPVHLLRRNGEAVQRAVSPDNQLMLSCSQRRHKELKRRKAAVVVAEMLPVQINIGMALHRVENQPDMLLTAQHDFFAVPADTLIFIHSQLVVPAGRDVKGLLRMWKTLKPFFLKAFI
ncbi:hypothetical protein D3C75_476120 [compost metagenome]